MAERTNAYAESTGRSTTTSTTVGGANKVRLTHTPGSDETWAYLADVTVDKSSGTTDVLARLRNETTSADWGNINYEPTDTTNRINISWLKVHTYGSSPGSQDIDIDYWSESSGTAAAADAHIWGLKLTADDKSAASDGQTNRTSTSFLAKTTLTETLAGDYLILCTTEILNTTANPIVIKAVHNSTDYGLAAPGTNDAATWRTWGTAFKLAGLSGSQTIEIQFAAFASGDNVSIRNARILAIKLGNFANVYSDEDHARATNNTATPADRSVLTFTPAATRNHLALGVCIGDHNSSATNGFVEFERDGTAISQHQEEPDAASEDFSLFTFRRQSLSSAGSTTYKTQYWSETTNTTGIEYSGIYVLDLEAAAGGSVFSQSALAQTAPITALVRQTGKPFGGATSPAATVARLVAKALAASTTPPSALTRSTEKPLSASTTPPASLTVSRLFLKALDAVTAPLAALTRQTGKVLGAVTTPPAALSRAIAKALAAATTSSASLTRLIDKPLQASSSPSAALIALRIFLVTLAAATAPLAALMRQTGKALPATSPPLALLSRAVAKVLLKVTSPVANLVSSKTFIVALQSSAAAIPALARLIAKPLVAATPPAATLARQTGKFVAVPVSASTSLVRGIAKALAANAFVTALLDLFLFASAKADPYYLLVPPARVRGVIPFHARAIAAGEIGRGLAGVHVRGLAAPAKDRDEP